MSERIFSGYVVDEWVGTERAAVVTSPDTPAPPSRAVVYAATTANSADTRENAKYWRKLGAQSSRNLLEFSHKQMVEQCSRSAQSDGMARAHVRLMTNYTVGSMKTKPVVKCEDIEARDALQAHADTFWKENNLGKRLCDLQNGLTTTGSLATPMKVGQDATGRGSQRTRMGYLDPATFVAPFVLPDPDDVLTRTAVIRRHPRNDKVIAHPIIQENGEVHAEFEGKKEGEAYTIALPERVGGSLQTIVGSPCLYTGVNCISPSQSCGISDLYPSLDLMGLLDELVFGAVQRSINIGAFTLHVTFPSGTPEAEVKTQMEAMRLALESGDGQAVGTTEDVGIKAVFAALQAGEWSTLEKTARTSALIGLGPWPVHLFSDGGATNVATAAEQGSPVSNILLGRQNVFKAHIVGAIRWALLQIPEAAALIEANPDCEIELPLPVIVAKDTTREANTLQVETNVLVQAVDEGLLTLLAAQREWRKMANGYSFEVAPEDAPDAEEFEEQKSVNPFAGLPMPGEDPDPDDDEEDEIKPPPTKLNEGTPSKAA